MVRKNKPWFLFTLSLITLATILLAPEWYQLAEKKSPSPQHNKLFQTEALKALITKDIPVAAFLVYKDSVIGIGHNEVEKNKNLGMHAEIMALSDAWFGLGSERFRELNPDSLVLYTSLEPCQMCRGAMIEYGINQVDFLKSKGFQERWTKSKNLLGHYFRRRALKDNGLQDSLLRLHPAYQAD